MKEDISVVKLRARLVGKTVTSVEQSTLSESYYHIRTSDGESFHICGTELGSWIVDGPRHDGTFPSISALVRAVTDHRYERQMYDEDVEVVLVDGVMVVDAGDGETFQIRPSGVKDPWEKSVLTHPRAVHYLRSVIKSGEFWISYFNKARQGEKPLVPDELLLSPEEAEAKARA